MSDSDEQTAPKFCAFRKAGKRKAQNRQRTNDGDKSPDQAQAEIIRDAGNKRRRQNPMIQSTKKTDEKKPRGDDSSSEESEDGGFIRDLTFSAEGSSAPKGPRDMGATATNDIETDVANDAQAQFERVQRQLDEGLEKDGKTLYKGAAMYGAKKAKDTAMGSASSGMNRIGPIRTSQFVRQTILWDYKPDVCKDYKETGYCTFGDSCKFMHDRGDYKHGWEIEQDYQEALKKKNEPEENYEIESDSDDLPDACQICREEFVNPVVSKCKHYFCENCAIKAYSKSMRCFVCDEKLLGNFNVARDILAKMAKEKEAQGPSTSKQAAKEDKDDGDDDFDDEDDGDSSESDHANDLIGDTEMELLPDEDDKKRKRSKKLDLNISDDEGVKE